MASRVSRLLASSPCLARVTFDANTLEEDETKCYIRPDIHKCALVDISSKHHQLLLMAVG